MHLQLEAMRLQEHRQAGAVWERAGGEAARRGWTECQPQAKQPVAASQTFP